MRKHYLTLIAAFGLVAFGQSLTHNDGGFIGSLDSGATAAPTYLVDEGFEGTGQPTDWVGIGSPQYDCTVAAVGSQAFELKSPTSDTYARTQIFTPASTCYLFCRLYISNYSGIARDIFHFRTNNAATLAASVGLSATGQLQCGYNTSGTMSTGAWYYVWASYNASTGAKTVAFSTTSTCPTSGTGFTNASQTGTGPTDAIRFYSDYSGTNPGPHIIIDHVLVDDEVIGDNP
jgi:hypothetical protein